MLEPLGRKALVVLLVRLDLVVKMVPEALKVCRDPKVIPVCKVQEVLLGLQENVGLQAMLGRRDLQESPVLKVFRVLRVSRGLPESRVFLEKLGQLALLVLRDLKVLEVQRDPLDRKAIKVNWEIAALKASKALLGLEVLKVLRVLKVYLELLVKEVKKVLRVQQVQQVQQDLVVKVDKKGQMVHLDLQGQKAN